MYLTLDFETYFGTKYTLKNSSTSGYVYDERFRIHGMAVKVDDYRSEWVHRRYIREWLNDHPGEEYDLVAHNAHFDGFILHHCYDWHPRSYICTLAMARPLMMPNYSADLDTVAQVFGQPPKEVDILDLKNVLDPDEEQAKLLENRAVGDVDRTKFIFDRMFSSFTMDQMKVIDLTIRMFCDPVFELDRPLVEKVQAEDLAHETALLEKLGVTKELVRSDAKYKAYLEEQGLEVPMKWSVKQEKEVPAFAKNDLEFMKWQTDPAKAIYYKTRIAAKSTTVESKTKRLLSHPPGAPLPLFLNFCGAHTFRFSGGDKMNPQNITRGSELRRAIKAPKGHYIAVVDASQIEARLNAWLSGQDDLLDLFRRKDAGEDCDPYKEQAADTYRVPVSAVTADQRFVGKTLVLAAGYGMGWAKFQMRLATDQYNPLYLSDEDAKNAIYSYRDKNHAIKKNWNTMNNMIRWMFLRQQARNTDSELQYGPCTFTPEGVLMPNGFVMRYPDIRLNYTGDFTYKTVHGRTKIYGGYLTENLCQSLGACILMDHMASIAEWYRVGLTVHDEIVALIPKTDADTHFAKIQELAAHVPDWADGLPLACEGGYDEVYSK